MLIKANLVTTRTHQDRGRDLQCNRTGWARGTVVRISMHWVAGSASGCLAPIGLHSDAKESSKAFLECVVMVHVPYGKHLKLLAHIPYR